MLAIVVAPHVRTLVRLSQIPKGHRIGIAYSTEHQAEAIQQSLADTGLDNAVLISGHDDPALDECDLVVVPSENPELGQALGDRVPLLEFGNILSTRSIRIVSRQLSTKCGTAKLT